MISCKGVYEWKLVHKDTGEIIQEGSQNNVVTDDFLWSRMPANTYNTYEEFTGYIRLSTTPLPAPIGTTDIRRRYHANNVYNTYNISGGLGITINNAENSISVANNFGPLGTGISVSYTAIGLELRPYDCDWGCYKASVVELSTPITHNEFTYLYVSYKMYINPAIDGENSPNNVYVNTQLRTREFVQNRGYCALIPYSEGGDYHIYGGSNNGYSYATNWNNSGVHPGLTSLLPAKNKNNIGRTPELATSSIKTLRYNRRDLTSNASLFGIPYYREYGVDEMNTLLGTVVYRGRCPAGDYDRYSGLIFGQSPITPKPTINRAFMHAAGRTAFQNDPSYPPESRGVIQYTGTPTNEIQQAQYVTFTKTGQATNDAATQATYKLKVTPHGNIFNNWSAPSNVGMLFQDLNRTISARYAPEFWNDPCISMIKTIWQRNNNDTLLYSIQQDNINTPLLINTWEFATIESPVPIAQIGPNNGSHKLSGIAKGKGTYIDHVYIGTTGGIYDYNYVDNSVTLLSVTGIIDTNIRDIAFDSVTEKLWVGHYNGISRISLDTLVGETFNRTNGLSVLTSNDQCHIMTGQLTVIDDIVLRGGGTYTGFTRSTCSAWIFPQNYRSAWIFNYRTLSGTMIYNANGVIGATMISSTKLAVVEQNHGSQGTFKIYNFDGSSWVNSLNINDGISKHSSQGGNIDYGNPFTQLIYYNNYLSYSFCDNSSYGYFKHIVLNLNDNSIGNYQNQSLGSYYESSGLQSVYNRYYVSGNSNPGQWLYRSAGLTRQLDYTDEPYSSFNQSRQIIYINDCPITFIRHLMLKQPHYWFGWDANNQRWVLNEPNSRPMTPEQHDLMHGVKATFNNTVGVAWDKQYVINENSANSYGQLVMKDNLQKYKIGFKYYLSKTTTHTRTIIIPPAAGPYCTYTIPEASMPNFRDMDSDWYSCYEMGLDTLKVIDNTTGLPMIYRSTTTEYNSQNNMGSIFNSSGAINIIGTPIETGSMITNVVRVGSNVATGWDWYGPSTGQNYWLHPFASRNYGHPDYYYAIKISDTQIKLATTYTNAINNIPVTVTKGSSWQGDGGNIRLSKINIASGDFVTLNWGEFKFNPTDAGKEVTIKYTCTWYS